MSGMQSQSFIGHGTYTFTPGPFTNWVWITMSAAGAGGAGASQAETPAGAVSGAAGEYVFMLGVPVTPNVGVTVNVGLGGAGGVPVGTSGPTMGAAGGVTSFGNWAVLGGKCLPLTSGQTGGGPGGGNLAPAAPGGLDGQVGAIGVGEGPPWFGGDGSSSPGGVNIGVGGPGAGDPGIFPGAAGGGTSGLGGSQSGGAGGASSPWGIGGAGGDGGDNVGTNVIVGPGWGHDAPSASYGAGGGGSGAAFTSFHQKPGGKGADGVCYVFWVG